MPHERGMNEGRDRNEREREVGEPEGTRREQRENRGRREDGEPKRERQERGRDVIRGRDFAGTNIFATEREQTLDAERARRGESSDEFLTEAELDAREPRAEDNED
jgi:hypothetical protein